jgi:hypothetical protein
MTTLFPYDTLSAPLSLTISNLRIDDVKPTVDVLVPDARLVNAYLLPSQDWSTASFNITVSGNQAELEAFEKKGAEFALHLVVSCSLTNTRQTIRLQPSAAGEIRWAGKIMLDRLSYRGRSAVYGVLAGTVNGSTNRFLGQTEEWSVHFDLPAILPLEGSLPVKWLDFTSERAASHLQANQHEPFYADLTIHQPTVYLNSSIPGYQNLLSDRKGRSPLDAALHNSERVGIARAVWLQLFNASLAGITVEEDEEPTWPGVEWQRQVLKALIPMMYEESSDAEALHRAAEARGSNDGVRDLQSRAQLAISKRMGVARIVSQSMNKLSRTEVTE